MSLKKEQEGYIQGEVQGTESGHRAWGIMPKALSLRESCWYIRLIEQDNKKLCAQVLWFLQYGVCGQRLFQVCIQEIMSEMSVVLVQKED